MDDIDVAQERIERTLAQALRRAQLAGDEAKPRGACLFCEHPLKAGQRWCDADCRDDWEAEQRAARDPRNIVAQDD